MRSNGSDDSVGAGPRAGARISSGREKLLAAALRQVRENEFSAVTARTICQEAGITAPTLYHHFGDLNGLYSEVLGRLFEAQDARHPDESRDPLAVIDYVWTALLRIAEHESGVINLLNLLLASGTIPDLMRRNYQRLEAAFEIAATDRALLVDSRLAAEMYWAAALGMATLVAATQHGVPYPTGASDVLRRAVLVGIFGSEPGHRRGEGRSRPPPRRR